MFSIYIYIYIYIYEISYILSNIINVYTQIDFHLIKIFKFIKTIITFNQSIFKLQSINIKSPNYLLGSKNYII